MTHQVIKTQTGFGIQNLASGGIYGSFETFADALSALCEAGLADQRSVSDPSNY